MNVGFSLLERLIGVFDQPCASCPAEPFPARFEQMEHSLRAALPEKKGYRLRACRRKDQWAIRVHQGIFSGLEVVCTPVYATESYTPSEFSIRVRADAVFWTPFAYVLTGLYFFLIALPWFGPLLGWDVRVGPGMMAIVAFILVIWLGLGAACIISFFLLITGRARQMWAHMDNVRRLAGEILASGMPPSPTVKQNTRLARRVRLILGGTLAAVGIWCVTIACLQLSGGDIIPALLILFVGAVMFFLAYGCWRRPRDTPYEVDNSAAVIAAMQAEPRVTPEDVAELDKAIAEGRRPPAKLDPFGDGNPEEETDR